jgi:hypothetical protein
MLLVIHNKRQHLDNGKQRRSLENIPLETLFVTKPYESSPPPYRLDQISGGPPVDWFCYDINFGFGSNCSQTRPHMEISNIIK